MSRILGTLVASLLVAYISFYFGPDETKLKLPAAVVGGKDAVRQRGTFRNSLTPNEMVTFEVSEQ